MWGTNTIAKISNCWPLETAIILFMGYFNLIVYKCHIKHRKIRVLATWPHYDAMSLYESIRRRHWTASQKHNQTQVDKGWWRYHGCDSLVLSDSLQPHMALQRKTLAVPSKLQASLSCGVLRPHFNQTRAQIMFGLKREGLTHLLFREHTTHSGRLPPIRCQHFCHTVGDTQCWSLLHLRL